MNTVSIVTDLLDHNSIEKDKELLYWKKGLCCHSGNVRFVIESYQLQDVDEGISVLYSPEVVQQGLLAQLVNLIPQIVSEWFPGLVKQLEQIFICYECAKINCQTTYKFAELLECMAEGKLRCTVCQNCLNLKILAPDLLLGDMDRELLLSFDNV